jgi:hypothetical protein
MCRAKSKKNFSGNGKRLVPSARCQIKKNFSGNGKLTSSPSKIFKSKKFVLALQADLITE